MDPKVKEYLAEIGRIGGRKSRRTLAPEAARRMVAVREARRAYRRSHTSCFWSHRPDIEIGVEDVAWVGRYLAGGAALHFAPNSHRYNNSLDFFHDSEERVASAFAADAEVVRRTGWALDVELSQPGHTRARVSQGDDSTRIDWAHDSSWRFMPPVRVDGGGLPAP